MYLLIQRSNNQRQVNNICGVSVNGTHSHSFTFIARHLNVPSMAISINSTALSGEGGYYLTVLEAAIEYIRTVDPDSDPTATATTTNATAAPSTPAVST
jgi:hypothetical protein